MRLHGYLRGDRPSNPSDAAGVYKQAVNSLAIERIN